MALKQLLLTLERLKELLHYSPDTGLFLWKVARGCAKAGAVAGTSSKGYVSIKIDGKIYHAHRLAFFYMNGHWPIDLLDHQNRKKSDNKWGNIRPATQSQNNMNRTLYSNNKSGHKGVVFLKKYKRWLAYIGYDNMQKRLGYFKTREEAINAYRVAASKFHGEFACIDF